MASPVLPSTSSLLGVALVVNRSRDGPRFVFHYPPQIQYGKKQRVTPPQESAGDELDDDDEVLLNQLGQPFFEGTSASLPNAAGIQSWNHDDHLETESGSHIVPWEHVAGYPTRDLESLLTPSRAFHKRLFHVSLDQLCFVSSPVYVHENGIWRKQKRQPKNKHPKSPENGAEPVVTPMVPDSDVSHADGKDASAAEEDATVPAGGYARNENGVVDETEEKKSGMTMFNLIFILKPKKHEAKELAETLYVHIIRKINKLFKYSQQKTDFVWKESKRILALKDKSREERTKMSVLWKEILDVSSLAASVQDIYDAVSQNKIAALQLETSEGTITHSVQIPIPFYLTDLPPEEEADSTRGLWITTANYFVEEDSLHDPSFLDKHFGLLLMSDEKKVIAELQADADEATAAMVEFVRLSKPTMSFHQISQGSGLSPAQVRKYAQHFIFWRRGIAIPPLHARDIYVLSPNADFSLLPRASQAWARAFPLASHLAEFLAELSVAPRMYKWFCPSKIHRPRYLQMLAWLMRGGWVTQLCTFAYVVVWPEILYEVEYELEAEELKTLQEEASKKEKEKQKQKQTQREQQQQQQNTEQNHDRDKEREKDEKPQRHHHHYHPHHQQQQEGWEPESDNRDRRYFHHRPTSPAGSSSTIRAGNISLSASTATLDLQSMSPAGAATEGPGLATSSNSFLPHLLSPAPLADPSSLSDSRFHNTYRQDTPLHSEPPSASNSPPTAAQTQGERFALAARLSRIADKEAQAAYERSSAFARKPQPVPTPHPSLNTSAHLAHLSPYVIVDPRRATGKDSLYLSAIGRRFSDPKVRAAWPVFWKYFNGRAALERVVLGLGGDGASEGLGLGGSGSGSDKMKIKKRKEAWALMTAMSEHLLCIRHF
ncbi:nitrogen permease regulator of amino acid transport activity 3-domain-containing protein [Nemania sp. NC0429]|nr:nitrogen permease regulator of amino acid transport activity 3-domain-containing protein [Nemania sp. NC0429]